MKQSQDDFRAGMVTATATDKVPSNGLLVARDCMVDNEGALRRRGGCSYQSNANVGARLVFLWTGYLLAGARTLLAAISGTTGTTATLGNDLATPTTLVTRLGVTDVRPRPWASINGWLIALGTLLADASISVYAGARKVPFSASGASGTVTRTNGSKTVTGVGTSFLTWAEPGMILSASAGALGTSPQFAVVRSVQSNTSLTLQDAWEGITDSFSTFTFSPIIDMGTTLPDGSTPVAVAAVGDRLCIASSSGRVYVSAGRNPTTGALRPWYFDATGYHEMPAGASLLALAGLRDRLFIFTTAGIYVLSNVAFDIVDAAGNPQRRLELHSTDVVAVGTGAGITTFRDALVVPASDDIYLVDGISSPLPVSASARREWRKAARDGYMPGNAVAFRGHYVMPLVDSAGVPSMTWLFRLDRPAETGIGTVFPFTLWSAQAGEVAGFTTLRGATDELWAAGAGTGGRVLDVTEGFSQDSTAEADADGLDVTAAFVTRDYVGAGTRTVWRRVRLRYKLGVGGSIVGAHYVGGDEEPVSPVGLSGAAPAQAQAVEEFTWDLQRMSERVRFAFSVGGGDRFVLYSIEVEGRDPGRAR